LAVASNNQPVLKAFLTGDVEDAPPGLLHDAIALSGSNAIAKELISKKYKNFFNQNKVY